MELSGVLSTFLVPAEQLRDKSARLTLILGTLDE
jgi:hypothetical protein